MNTIKLFNVLVVVLAPVLICDISAFRPRPVGKRQTSPTTGTGTGLHAQRQEAEAQLRAVTFSNLAKDQEPALLCDYLMELGACSVAIIDADRGTDKEKPIFGEPSDNVVDETEVWASTRTGVWDSCNVTAHFSASADLESLLTDDDAVRDIFFPTSSDFSYHVEQVPNKDWVVHVQQSWKPIVVAQKFILTFPWHDQSDIRTAAADQGRQETELGIDELVELKLQGGIAFGTGEHATTQLCMEWIDKVVSDLVEKDPNDDNELVVLDYGAGSGVLGMAACALAPGRVRSVGVDVDADACRIANANAVENELDMRNYLPCLGATEGDDESKSLLLKAQSRVLGSDQDDETLIAPETELGSNQYHVCVANILAGALVGLAPTLYDMLRPGGALGLSGILQPQADTIVETYVKAGFENVQIEREAAGWVLVTGRKPNEHSS